MNIREKVKIAVVDDHHVTIRGMISLIKNSSLLKNMPIDVMGFEVQSRDYNGTEDTTLESLLGRLQSFTPEIIFLDFGLSPDFDGVHVAEIWKRLRRSTKILMNTGYEVKTGRIDTTIPNSNLNVPDNVTTRILNALDDRIIDKVHEKTEVNLDKVVLGLLPQLHMPLPISIIGRGIFGDRLLQELFPYDSIDFLYSMGKSVSDDDLLKRFEIKNGGKLVPISDPADLLKGKIIINCASKLRGNQVPKVIKYEKRTQGFYPDRRVILAYENERLEQFLNDTICIEGDNIAIRDLIKDIPVVDLSNPIPYLQWLRYSLGHNPKFIYSPLEPDTSRLLTTIAGLDVNQKFLQINEGLERFVTGVHGEVRTIIPKDLFLSPKEIEELRKAETEAMQMAYDSQEVAAKLNWSPFQPQVTNATFFEDLIHFRTPLNVTGYMSFEDSNGWHEGFISYPPLVDFRDLSITPDWDTIERLIGKERFISIAAPYLDEQKKVFYDIMSCPYKYWNDSMISNDILL